MSHYSTHVNEKGEVMCKIFRRKFKLDVIKSWVRYDRFVRELCVTKQDGCQCVMNVEDRRVIGFLYVLKDIINGLNEYKESQERLIILNLIDRRKYTDESILHNMRNSKNEWTHSICIDEAERRGLI